MANWDDTELPAPWDWKKFLPPEPYGAAMALLPGMDTNRAPPGPGDFGGSRAPSVVPGNAPVMRPAIGALVPGDRNTFGQSWSSTPPAPSLANAPPSLGPPQQSPTGPGRVDPAVLGVPPGSGVAMPNGGPGLGGFGTVKPTGNPPKADEDSWDKKLLKMIQDKNFIGAIDALTGGPGKAPQGSPPKMPKNQLSGMVAMRQYPTVAGDAKGILAGASGPAALDMLKPLPGAAKNAPLQKRYDILNKRQTGLAQLLQELG